MNNKNEKRQFTLSFSLTPMIVVFILIVISLLLVVIGVAVRNVALPLIGISILALTLTGGGLLLGKENLTIRVTLLVIGGLIIIYLATIGSISSIIVGLIKGISADLGKSFFEGITPW